MASIKNKKSKVKEPSSKNGKKERAVSPKVKATPNPKPQKTEVSISTGQDRNTYKTSEPSKVIVPEIVDGQPEEQDISMFSDGTSIPEISIMENLEYSREIISEVRNVFNLSILRDGKLKKNPKKYLGEAHKQIDALWDGIHGLVIHTEMFTVLFLVAIGSILKEIKDEFEKPHEFARWRDTTFGIRHRRLFQQAIQLEAMGEFSRKYSPIGKTRLLQLEHIRKVEKMESCEDLLRECQVYDEITEDVLPDKIVEKMDVEPFPDISYDLDSEQIKRYVNSIVSYKRFRRVGLNFVDFEYAQIISEDYQQAIPKRDVVVLKSHLEKYPPKKRLDIFKSFVMDGSKIGSLNSKNKRSRYSLNKHISDLITFFKKGNLDDDGWIKRQKKFVDKDLVQQGMNYLNLIADKMGFNTNEQASQQ